LDQSEFNDIKNLPNRPRNSDNLAPPQVSIEAFKGSKIIIRRRTEYTHP
jgi:hypothetical protein